MRILVTGGAGYIGSHVAWLLQREGHQPVVFDNLSTGHADAVAPGVALHPGHLLDRGAVREAFLAHKPEAVMHFAALSLVAESARDPRRYFYENLVGALNLLDGVREHGIRHIVFSSTAATYGIPITTPIPENHPQSPVNCYGDTKLAIERMLVAYEQAYGLRHATLRYFNAAGALASAGLGERHEPESHLIPLILRVALGQVPEAQIFGRDYDTPDGTCIRDYIHIMDLAEAHLRALDHILAKDVSLVLNLGTGQGHTVLEVLDCARKITGHPIPAADHGRRPGDPPVLVAATQQAAAALKWTARHSNLANIIQSAWDFQRQKPACQPATL